MSGFHSFSVGQFQCVAVSDGTNAYPAAHVFTNAPPQRRDQVLRQHNLPSDAIVLYHACLAVDTGKHRVLVDTGIGPGGVPTAGMLLQSLNTAGIDPASVDTVVLTHGHPDHIGTNTREGRPTFPNARYIISKTDLNFWTSTSTLDRLASGDFYGVRDIDQFVEGWIRNHLLPIRSRIETIDGEREIVPGVRAIPAPGHTPGHISVQVSSANQTLLCTADAVIHPIHLQEPDWFPMFDVDKDEAARTRRKILDRAAADKAMLLTYHFPFPGLGRVTQQARGWVWTPVSGAAPA